VSRVFRFCNGCRDRLVAHSAHLRNQPQEPLIKVRRTHA